MLTFFIKFDFQKFLTMNKNSYLKWFIMVFQSSFSYFFKVCFRQAGRETMYYV